MNATSQGVIFTVPQICAYFVDNPHNLEIDSFRIAVSEHILLYFKNSNSFFLCTHDNVRHTLCMLCVISWCTFVFDRQTFHILSPDMCIHSHFKIKSTSHAVRNIIPSNNGLGVEKIVIFLVTGQYFVYVESQYFLVAGVYGKQNIKTSRFFQLIICTQLLYVFLQILATVWFHCSL